METPRKSLFDDVRTGVFLVVALGRAVRPETAARLLRVSSAPYRDCGFFGGQRATKQTRRDPHRKLGRADFPGTHDLGIASAGSSLAAAVFDSWIRLVFAGLRQPRVQLARHL